MKKTSKELYAKVVAAKVAYDAFAKELNRICKESGIVCGGHCDLCPMRAMCDKEAELEQALDEVYEDYKEAAFFEQAML
jgi:hypothetical protein